MEKQNRAEKKKYVYIYIYREIKLLLSMIFPLLIKKTVGTA